MNENFQKSSKCKNCYKNEKKTGSNVCQSCYDKTIELMKKIEKSRTNFYPEIDQINEKIYLGNYDGQREIARLQEAGVKAILVCGSYLNTLHPSHFEYKVFEIDDSLDQQIEHLFEEAFEFIEKHEKVYVHCAAGISRSSSFVIAYLMKKNGWNFEKTLEYVKEKRSCVNPNSNFEKQLKNYQIKLENI